MDRFRNTRQPDWEWWGELWPNPQRVLQKLGIEADEALADIGSGNGYFTLPAAELVVPAPVYAVDIDTELLAELSENAEQAGLSNIQCIDGDARELESLLPELVDVVLIANTFHGVEEPAMFAQQAYQSLTLDGRLIVVNWHNRPKEETPVAGKPRGPPTELRLPPEQTENQLSPAPFTTTRLVDLPPYHYAHL